MERTTISVNMVLLLMIVSIPRSSFSFALQCNGKDYLCDRPYNKIAQINVHNATSTTKKGFVLPIIPCMKGWRLGLCDYNTGINPTADQYWDLDDQLKHGLRVFKIPLHPIGKDNTPWAAHTVSSGEIDALAADIAKKVPLGKDTLKKAISTTLKDNLWKTDTTNIRFLDVLHQLKRFLDQNPREVITLELNAFSLDHMKENLLQDFRNSGINRYLFIPALWPAWPQWPTLGQMIQRNQRLVVLIDDDRMNTPGFLHSGEYKVNNEYHYETLEALNNDYCEKARSDNPHVLFGMVHNLTGAIAGSPEFADKTNRYAVLQSHVQRCLSRIGRYPNFISIDFVDKHFDDLNRVIDELNKKEW